jgi:hypothetical protein|tara:strand:+ start:217 stop:357 length:141 start_codon:yes stop_codon:yes gene_type:complete|eukprot:SAG11_NODE_2_length_63684_cov_167.801195_68_plen_47_part_00
MAKSPKWILYNDKKKKCFGIHTNGNYIVKMNGTLVQIPKEKIEIYG